MSDPLFDVGIIKPNRPGGEKPVSDPLFDRGTIPDEPNAVSLSAKIAARKAELRQPDRAERLLSPTSILDRGTIQFDGSSKEPFSTRFNKPSADISLPDVLGELLFGTQRETDATEALSEFGGIGGSQGLNASQAAQVAGGLLATMDPQAQMDIIRDAVPGVAFQEDEKGNIIVAIPQEGGGFTKSILNQPGISLADARTLSAQVLAFFPAAKLASIGKSLLTKVGLGALGAGTTDVALQKTSQALGSEQPFDLAQTAITTVLGGGAEAAGPLLRTGKRVLTGNKAAPVDALPSNSRLVDIAEEASQKTGVDLFPAQKTVIPSELGRQNFVAQLPGGAQIAMKALAKQNTQAFDATQKFLRAIAPEEVVSTGAKRFKTAAEESISRVKLIRKEAASPIYKQAARRQRELNQPPIDTTALEVKTRKIAEQFSFKGEIGKNLLVFSNRMKTANGSIAKLHNLKIELDQKIAKIGEGSVGNTTKKFLSEVKSDLTEALVKQSPSYRAARQEFIRTSPAVSELTEGVIGKATKLKDVDLKRLSSSIFDAAETNPRIVQRVRSTIDTVDPGAYDDLLRVEIERRVGSMRTTQEAIENLPGQLNRAIFGNEKQRRTLLVALRPKQREEVRYLETVLRRASMGRPGGSPTAANEEIKKEIRGGVANAIRRFLSTDLTKPGAQLAKLGEEAQIQSRAKAFAELIYNPSYQKSIKGIRELEKIDRNAANKTMQSLLRAIKSELAATPSQSKGLPEDRE